MITSKFALNKRKTEVLASILLVAVFVLPFLSFAASRKDIYVDDSASGKEDGSEAHPYKTISEALVHADKRTDVHVEKGFYEDNIEIPKGVRIYGSDRNQVIIHARSSHKVVVSMKDDARIDGVTIEHGKNGVWIDGEAQASVINCVIRKNESDGIRIEHGSAVHEKISITDSRIEDNGRAGIFADKRRIVLINNEIINNDKDGVALAAGTSAWIEDNEIKNNDRSGMNLILDRSDIWLKKNHVNNNDAEGIEINACGNGRIDINKTDLLRNGNYGIARVLRCNTHPAVWNGFTVRASEIGGNGDGDTSGIIPLF